MQTLITGGAGFIGSHLTDRLVEQGDRVVVLDDLSTGLRSNLDGALAGGRAELVRGSVLDAELVHELVGRADRVFHLAAGVGVRRVVERPVSTLRTNVRGAETVLEAAARHERPILLASSSEVYGRGARLPFREEDDLVLGPTASRRWGYACSKALDEWLAFAWRHETGLPVVVARLFNTVGPRQRGRYGMVLPSFAAQALAGRPLTVHGDGRQTRCFAHVRDTVEALLRLIECDAARGLAVNVGTDREVEIRAVAEAVRAAAGSSSPIVHVSYEEAYGTGFEDMRRRRPCLERLRSLTGFAPETPLEEAVADVVADRAVQAELARARSER